MYRRVRAAVLAALVLSPLALTAGCGSGTPTDPGLSPEENKEQMKQLNEHRQKEWGNKKN